MVWVCGICWRKLEGFAPDPEDGYLYQRAEAVGGDVEEEDGKELEEILKECEMRQELLSRGLEGVKRELYTEDFSTFLITPCGHAFHKECLKEWMFVSRRRQPNLQAILGEEEEEEDHYRCGYCCQGFHLNNVIRCFPTMLADEKAMPIASRAPSNEGGLRLKFVLPIISLLLTIVILFTWINEKIDLFESDAEELDASKEEPILLGYDFAFLLGLTCSLCLVRDWFDL